VRELKAEFIKINASKPENETLTSSIYEGFFLQKSFKKALTRVLNPKQ
jgi:hypothetical protein